MTSVSVRTSPMHTVSYHLHIQVQLRYLRDGSNVAHYLHQAKRGDDALRIPCYDGFKLLVIPLVCFEQVYLFVKTKAYHSYVKLIASQ